MANEDTICLRCRLRLLASASRSAAHPLFPRAHTQTRSLRSFAAVANTSQCRRFTTAPSRSIEAPEASKTTSDETLPPQAPTPSTEESVRAARRLHGDTLPKGYLSEEEYAVYERLYGPPIFTEEADLVEDEVELAADEVEGEEMQDQVWLREGEDGELEEVELYKQSDELADEALEEDYESIEGEFVEAETDFGDSAPELIKDYHQDIYEKTRLAEAEADQDAEDLEEGEEFMRAHPLTVAGRFATSPSTLHLPKEKFVDPTAAILSQASHKHITQAALKIFGGPGLPQSASTARASEGKEQKTIPLDPSQEEMSSIQSNTYMAAVMPGVYATSMSTIVEVRRRLGTAWIEGLMKESGPLILDAGSGGAAIVAWREVLEAEWKRMNESSGQVSQEPAPLGKATVLTASNALKLRASRLLENTSFIPRLPDAIPHNHQAVKGQQRKVYDIIIAPHALWPLRQEYHRKEHVQRLWSLLNPDGGVLILLEKGLPRGFEIIASARSLLLDKHIASPDSTEYENSLQDQLSETKNVPRFTKKETGMIVAPCTNHSTCPMYTIPGVSQGRKDFCYFSQRYIRPPYLQRIHNARDRNHEDVQYSYLAVQRGRDQRKPKHDIFGKGFSQGDEATEAAFKGHEFVKDGESSDKEVADEPEIETNVNALSLPRLVVPAMKRRGHIILEVCTPSAKIERWTVPRSFSKQAFRDARKARWGDLWALGAKTRIAKTIRMGLPRNEQHKRPKRKMRSQTIEIGVNPSGNVIPDGMKLKKDGRLVKDRKNSKTGRKGRKMSEADFYED
ncbi:uncharacterized protein BDZ99DRAFT_491933 [Mytilinidion resinicola]|uniref:Rsm22-domain-containing protein n=1 Tax=Mytilinidion resinicola TaxID=574789 RepID=A0A6A6Y272_9PEZI|nr:uncharacterized protein BDZ99DRAFT_491933 [Mytilinidion resinicola]KAF2802916.1 hypothetical protein BDZ99DRAFT_491933 [Mytilinidion resinicola]